jgi:NAD(P)H-hydrate epimerase
MLEQVIVSAEQMRLIEEQIFQAGMPVAALMEKAAGLCARRIQSLYPRPKVNKVGILVGPGHNGGDALVVARELHLAGYQVKVCRLLSKLKELTQYHSNYAESLSIPSYEDIDSLQDCELIIDGLFGFGLTRSLSGKIAEAVDKLNSWSQSVVSIDIPSGLHTDTGEVLGTAVRATYSLCLGLWKRAFFQDRALPYIGTAERLDFGILPHHVSSILPQPAFIQQITQTVARQWLPLPRPLVTHKYQQGHLLLICGSRRYAGGAILTALGARASGVGMLSVAVPESLKPLLVTHLPEALIIGCPETPEGAIASLPSLAADYENFEAIACGPGLTTEAKPIVEAVLSAQCSLILDADGLNILAQLETIPTLATRTAATVLTPHPGEFKRLFPDLENPNQDRITATQMAAQQSNAVVLLKGARTAIANSEGYVWLVPASTPALARGGSGDVLTGLTGGLIAQRTASEKINSYSLLGTVATAAWWHAQAGIRAVQERTELGVDAFTLSQYLISVLTVFN